MKLIECTCHTENSLKAAVCLNVSTKPITDLVSKNHYIVTNISLERIRACSLIQENTQGSWPERNKTILMYAVYDIGQVLLTLEALRIYTTFMYSFKGTVLNQMYNNLDPAITRSCPRFCFSL